MSTLDGWDPHFRSGRGHIVQVQPRAARNAYHMSKVQACNSIALVIYVLVSKAVKAENDLHQKHLAFCPPSCAHQVADSRQASVSLQRRRVVGFEVRFKCNEELIFVWLVLRNISVCE